MKNKKLRAFLSGVLAVCFMLGAIVPASASGFLGGDLVKWVEDNWGNILGDLINGKSDDANDTAANDLTTTAATDSNFSKILHLDCGREYFSPEWIKALIVEMEKAGYNQLQLAFGNGGFRFYLDLDKMAIGEHSGAQVIEALEAGNEHYNTYGDDEKGIANGEWIEYNPEKNYLTESEMDMIIAFANSKHIEIVPMLNSPGHMHAVLAGMSEKLGMSNVQVSGKPGCLNLNNDDAVAFTAALVQKYVDYFASKGCKYFNLATDEYSSFNSKFPSYANSLIAKVVKAKMQPRVFNDALAEVTLDNNTTYPTEVCYWYSSSTTANAIANKGYKLINTNHDFYYVSTNEYWNLYREGYTFVGDYDQEKWAAKAQQFSNSDFYGYGDPDSSKIIGSMFCVWCNTPGKNTETQIAQDIRSILRIIGQRMNNVSTDKIDYSYDLDGGFNEDGTLRPVANTVYDKSDTIKVTAVGLTSLTANQLTDTADVKEKLDAVYPTDGTTTVKNFVAYDIIPATDERNYTGTATVSIRIPTDWNASRVKAFVVTDGKAEIISGEADNAFYTFTAPHFSVMGLVETQSNTPEIQIDLEVGQTKGTNGEYTLPGKNLTISDYNTDVVTVTRTEVGGEASFTETTTIDTSKQYVIGRNSNYLSVVKTTGDPNITNVTKLDEATKWIFVKTGNSYYITTEIDGTTYYLVGRANGLELSSDSSHYSDQNKWTYSNGKIYMSNYTSYYLKYTTANGWTCSNSNYYNSITLYEYKAGEADKTTLTFTGVTPGKTTVTVGKGDTAVTYAVTVTKKSAAKLYVDFWVTNMPVKPTNVEVTKEPSDSSSGENVTRAYIGIDKEAASNENGISIFDLINQKFGDLTTGNIYNTGRNVVLWKARYLPVGYRQTTAGWSNKSGEGTDTVTPKNGGFDFEYIRYDDTNGWQYKDEKGNWKPFPSDPTQDTSGAQIAIFYRQPTEVTDEVTTEVIDWPDKSTETFYGVAVDFAVKYEANGTRYPNSFGGSLESYWYNCDGATSGRPTNYAYKNGYTLYVGDDSNVTDEDERIIAYDWYGQSGRDYYRVINNINANETGDYEVYMITVTPSTADKTWAVNGSCPDTITYYDTSDTYLTDANGKEDASKGTITKTREKIIWAEDADTANNSDLSIHKDVKYGGNPEVERLIIQQGTGMLVTYYVRPKQAKANLIVHYIDKSNGYEFYNYGIITNGNKFDEGFKYDSTKEDYLINNTVINDQNNKVTVTGDLTKMHGVPARYRRIKFRCDSATIKADRTEVFIYYIFDNAKSYVVDFGIPVKITGQDLVNDNEITVTSMCLVDNKEKEHAEFTTRYGKAAVVNGEIKYQLTTMDFTKPENSMSVDTFTVRCKGYKTGNESQTDYIDYLIKIYPANSIYYEAETGVKNDTTTKVGDFITFEGDWTRIDDSGAANDVEKSDVYQALEALGNALYPFGYDPSYRTWSKFSLGSAMKSTVKKDTKDAPSATFTFTGTGFDVISLTSKTTGAVIVEVKDENGNRVRNYIVNSYYGYTYTDEEGWTPVKKTEDEEKTPLENALYQVPVIKVTNLDYGKYTVKIYTKYSSFFDILGLGWYSFYLDAIRIYDPAGDQFKGMEIKENDAPLTDELFDIAEYTEIRDIATQSAEDGTAYVVFVDGKDDGVQVGSDEFLKYSPNNEVYLKQNQKIAFKVKIPAKNIDVLTSVQLAAKLVNGTSVKMTSSVPFKTKSDKSEVDGLSADKKAVTITTATDMYYEFKLDSSNFAVDSDGFYYSAPIVIENSEAVNGAILSLTNLKVTYNKIPETATQITSAGKEIMASHFLISDDETVEAALNYTYVPEPEIPEEPEILPFEPEYISASWSTVGRYLRTCTLSVVTSRDVDKLTLDGSELTARTAFRRVNGKYQSVYVWTYVKMNAPKGDYELVAYNEDGVASEPVVVTLDK